MNIPSLKKLSVFQLCLLASLAVHAVVLTTRFAQTVDFERLFDEAPLDVILVNSQSDEVPERAQALAQANLAGGGDDADPNKRATSPLPPSAVTQMGDVINEETQRQIDEMLQQQNLMLDQVRSQLAGMHAPDPSQPGQDAERLAREDKRQQLFKLLAEIERRVAEENARPKKRFISPATREVVYAQYYDALRRKIETQGTANFPEVGGQKLYGSLTMMMTVNHDGRVLAVDVAESSGNPTLDRRAMAIARSAGPFEGFEPAMRKRADQIVVVSRFTFTRDQTLQTQLMGDS
ncbi:energy transducer TonB [Comamonas serinivorans]|uniref:Energy transducer TonB n=1 Tax=Comamonas serinivorans TaxID=1082851 RepID=A0A1Y0EKA5_9BURK|nr:TonB family protein [Comamonas serinivorans]ARU03799.1 energy transducer TonB [Comamonas serinivorans]